MTPPQVLILHEDPISGNCYKVRLVAAYRGLPIERRAYDIIKGETRTRAFLDEVDAEGRIPVLQVGHRFLPESNAAAYYLADGSDLIPQGPFARATMLRWLFWEQYNHEPNVATLRFWMAFVGEQRLTEARRAQVSIKRCAGEAALARLDRALEDAAFLLGNQMTLADLVLYPYTHVANEGGFTLAHYPAVVAWLARVRSSPGHISMQD